MYLNVFLLDSRCCQCYYCVCPAKMYSIIFNVDQFINIRRNKEEIQGDKNMIPTGMPEVKLPSVQLYHRPA